MFELPERCTPKDLSVPLVMCQYSLKSDYHVSLEETVQNQIELSFGLDPIPRIATHRNYPQG
jgi:hypothetical protein